MTEATDDGKRYRKGIIYQVNPDQLFPDPDQPRKYFEEQALEELTTSITKVGVLQPLLVMRRAEGGLNVVAGGRRLEAARRGGLATIPVMLTDGNAKEVALVENLQRENLTAIEEAEAIEQLRREHAYSLADLSKVIGKSESTLSEIISLNRLPEPVKADCRNDPKTARSILKHIAQQKTPEKMTALYERYKQRGLTRGEIVKYKRQPKAPEKGPLNLQFVERCLGRLNALETQSLEQAQLQQLAEALEKLRQAAQEKLDSLRTQTSGA